MPPGAPSFPTEIIEQIFAFFSTTLSTSDLAQFPWFLGHICSTWRSVYLSMTMEFWHSISISFNTRGTHTTRLVVQFFLERNPEAPFSFDLQFYDRDFSNHSEFSQYQMEDMHSVFEMLIDGSMRWEDVKFYCIRPADLLPLIHAKNRLLLLRELELSYVHNGDEVVPDQLHDVFETAPLLDTITMYYLADWKFNWPNLKTIFLSGLGSSAVVTALPQMTRLERLSMNTKLDPVPSSVFFLPNLKSLLCYSSWLPVLNTPALMELTIFCSDSGSDSRSINSFFRRSSCNILHLGIAFAQAATAIEIIKHVPQMAHLHFTEIDNVRNLFKQLTVSPNPSQELLARHMVSLDISDFSSVYDDDMGPFRDLILSRTIAADNNYGFKKLQKLNLSGPWVEVSDTIYDDFICLCKEHGVTVY